MPSQLPIVSYPQGVQLCSIADVEVLLTRLVGASAVNVQQAAWAIQNAQEQLQGMCGNRPLVPKRIQMAVDGAGKTRMVLPYYPLGAINTISVYYNYPLIVTRIAHEHDFNMERDRGIIAFPPYAYTAALQPFSFNFWRASFNVQLDYVMAFTQTVQGETLQTQDGLTYTFANQGVIPQSLNTVATQTTPPSYNPVVYKNGVPLVNTTYEIDPAGSGQWLINQSNIYYTLNTAASGGIVSLTMNSSASGSAITADYAYCYTPYDLRDACAKLAAITLVTDLATSPYYGDISTGGMTSVQANGFKTQANDRGQFGPQIATWETQIAQTVSRYNDPRLPKGVSYRDDNWSIRY